MSEPAAVPTVRVPMKEIGIFNKDFPSGTVIKMDHQARFLVACPCCQQEWSASLECLLGYLTRMRADAMQFAEGKPCQ